MQSEHANSPPFGDVLRRLRKAAGLTQEELAQRAQLSRNAINALERGARQSPRKDTVALLAAALALPDDEHAALLAASRLHRMQMAPTTPDPVVPLPVPASTTPPTHPTHRAPSASNLPLPPTP